jgi:lysophospholipid acyltransferase (LPLAT)-like uncharacterized protein
VPPSPIQQLSRRERLLVCCIAQLLRLLCATLRYRLVDEARFLEGPYPSPVVMLIWHNRILAMPTMFRRHYPKRKGLVVLASASRDGAFLTEFVRHFRMDAVRGSSSRRGVAALLDLTRRLEAGFDVCITPDGPRGPRYHLHPGALLLAQRARVALMPFLIDYSACWRLRSWDGFAIPKPFARVTVTVLPLQTVAPELSTAEFEEARRAVEELMVSRLQMR